MGKMNSFRRVIILQIIKRRRQRRAAIKNRKYWVHPLIQMRYIEGAFYTLFDKLRNDETKFFKYFRMSIVTFDYLLARLDDGIRRQDTHMRNCIPSKEKLALTIR